MKTHMERSYPILKDIGELTDDHPSREFVFLYDDGQSYRAFAASNVQIGADSVSAVDAHGKTICTIPSETPWRFIHKSNLLLVTGAEMEEADLRNLKQKRDLQKKLIKDFNLEVKDDEVKTEYSDKGYNPRLYP